MSSNVVNLILPEGYENATHVVVLAPGEAPKAFENNYDYEAYATILEIDRSGLVAKTKEVTEIGGGSLRQILILTARTLKEAFAK